MSQTNFNRLKRHSWFKERNKFNNIIEELSVEYGIAKEDIEDFIDEFFRQIKFQIKTNRQNFSITGLGKWTFLEAYSDEGRLIRKKALANNRQKTFYRRNEEKRLLIKKLHKLTKELDYILSLYN